MVTLLSWTWWGHGAELNTAALRALDIADTAADPLGGWYERDAAGRLTGRLDEYAEWGALGRLHSTLPEQEVVAGLRAFGDSSLRMGVTTVQNMAGYLDPGLTTRAIRRSAVKRAKLWLRQRNAAVILANVDRGERTASEVED